MQARDYQTAAMGDIRAAFSAGKRRVVYVLPTGGGKGWLVGAIAHGIWRKDKRALVLAHRAEIVSQLSGHLKAFGVKHGMIVGGQPFTPRTPMIVGSVFAVARRAHHMPPPDIIFVDECHHAVTGSTWSKVIDAFPNARILGMTATPIRLDGRGIGECFDTMIEGPTVAELMAQGYLTAADIYSTAVEPDLSKIKTRAGDFAVNELDAEMDRPCITGDTIAHYRNLADGKAAVVFCCSIKHAHTVADEFCRAGYRFVAVDGKMEPGERRKAIEDLKSGAIHGITSAEVISEGVDVPRIECVILLRPTQSLALHLQQIGRGLRPFPGKDTCIVLDHASNVKRHGFPDDEREWSLDGAPKRTASERVAPVRQCPICYAMHRPSPVCPKCGHVYIVTGREVEHVDGELVRMVGGEAVDGAEAARKERLRRYSILRNIGKRKKIENPSVWAFHIVATELATRLRRTRGEVQGTTNGLTEDELTILWAELGCGQRDEDAA